VRRLLLLAGQAAGAGEAELVLALGKGDLHLPSRQSSVYVESARVHVARLHAQWCTSLVLHARVHVQKVLLIFGSVSQTHPMQTRA
jgi:hypothetical protein